MNIDQVKSTYRNAGKNLKIVPEMKQHPSLRGMRQQLAVEILLWTLFLVVYYDFFDGDRKPILWNALLVTSVLFLLVHNILGYLAARNPIAGENIKQSLENYLQKLKRFSIVSVLTRICAVLAIMLFFISTITFDSKKYWIIVGLGVLLFIQVYVLNRVWSTRIRKIQYTLEEFSL